MDPLEKEIVSEDNNGSSSPQNPTKSCSDCHTTRTPLWRGGPAGPKSLCNACGIKYNKKRRAILGLGSGRIEKSSTTTAISKKKKQSSEVGRPLKLRFMTFGGGGGEEEQAAILLMALSCGSVYP